MGQLFFQFLVRGLEGLCFFLVELHPEVVFTKHPNGAYLLQTPFSSVSYCKFDCESSKRVSLEII